MKSETFIRVPEQAYPPVKYPYLAQHSINRKVVLVTGGINGMAGWVYLEEGPNGIILESGTGKEEYVEAFPEGTEVRVKFMQE